MRSLRYLAETLIEIPDERFDEVMAYLRGVSMGDNFCLRGQLSNSKEGFFCLLINSSMRIEISIALRVCEGRIRLHFAFRPDAD